MFDNIRKLRDSMREQEYIITSFDFTYNGVECIALVHDVKNEKKRNYSQYTLVYIELVKIDNIMESVEFEINSHNLLERDGLVKELREFFNIPYTSTGLRTFMDNFKESFANVIPQAVNPKPTKPQITVMVQRLSEFDSQDPNRIYCGAVRHNPVQSNGSRGRRSQFNSNKTKLLRSALFEKLSSDESISFIYYMNENQEKTDEEIISEFTERINN